jgi:hypothetical protein
VDAPAPERDATRLAAAYVAGGCVGDDPALKARGEYPPEDLAAT